MRGALILVALAGGLGLGAAMVARRAPRPDEGPAEAARVEREVLVPLASGFPEVTLGGLPQMEHAAELVDPDALLPTTHRHPPEEVRALVLFADTCTSTRAVEPSAGLAKAWAFHRALCAHAPLPASFFAAPPYVHPSGATYAALAGGPRAFMHVKELPDSPVAALHAPALRAVLRGDRLAAGVARVVVRTRPASDRGPARYAIIPFGDVNDALRADGSWLRVADSGACVVRDGTLCWQVDHPSIGAREAWASALGVASLAMLLGVVGWTVGGRVLAEARARRERALALRTLAHELRTPAASLALSLEPFRAEFDALSPELQSAFLRMCDEVQRLNRLVRDSTRYLREGAPDLAHPEPIAIDDFVRELIADPAVRFEPLGDGAIIEADPHALRMCLANLIDNALLHGAAPVVVRVRRARGSVVIEVADGGPPPALALAEMVRPFVKRPGSPGLGLGLEVVDRLAVKLGGKLELRTSPTTFSLVLRP